MSRIASPSGQMALGSKPFAATTKGALTGNSACATYEPDPKVHDCALVINAAANSSVRTHKGAIDRRAVIASATSQEREGKMCEPVFKNGTGASGETRQMNGSCYYDRTGRNPASMTEPFGEFRKKQTAASGGPPALVSSRKRRQTSHEFLLGRLEVRQLTRPRPARHRGNVQRAASPSQATFLLPHAHLSEIQQPQYVETHWYQ
jgi:hypothetical protein